MISLLFFFTAPATTEIYTLSLHDALPIYRGSKSGAIGTNSRIKDRSSGRMISQNPAPNRESQDRKSTRLNSSHITISYAVFCLKKKKKKKYTNNKQKK